MIEKVQAGGFQYHNGSIATLNHLPLSDPQIGFNTIMVRLQQENEGFLFW